MSTATRSQDRRPGRATTQRARFTISGVVQGVGFRPFVHRLATELNLTGFVGNDSESVFAEVEGRTGQVAEFERRLWTDAPPAAFVISVSSTPLPAVNDAGFSIVASRAADGARTLVAPDMATCDNCRAELFDPADRRYRHPFITCTDCGPRVTIIRDLPYDRPATTMADFAMCADCAREYADPTDRRFHAQPVACPHCGPVLRFDRGGISLSEGDEAIAAAQCALEAGQVVAVKGVGGYHLACRADDPDAVARLRERKARDQKPFALLVRDLSTAHRLAHICGAEEQVLVSRARPIVLLHRRADAPVDDSVAPGNPLLGLMLAYSPIHHLLLAPVPDSAAPAPSVLVMTSANVSDEPLCFDDQDARERLPLLADCVLTHDRPIHVPCDDSVVRVFDGHELPIRRSRGFAPLPVPVGRALPATLAVGGELKNTFCIVEGTNAFCSAHIGDMGSLDTLRAFDRSVRQLTTLHRLAPEVVVADAHPAYLTREWAERHTGQRGEPELRLVQHHHAHVVSLLAEHDLIGTPALGVAFDGTGYGDDGTIWGGEFLMVSDDVTRYERVAHLRTVDLPGGDAAVRNPCRTALAYLAASGVEWDDELPPVDACGRAELTAVRSQLSSGRATVPCSSMGRLFDAVAAILGVRQRIGYEAQAAIELEILATSAVAPDAEPPWAFEIEGGLLDYAPVVRGLVGGWRAGVDKATLARWFHLAVAEAVTTIACQACGSHDEPLVGLTGGVFQNVLLLDACRRRLASRGFRVLVHEVVPPNDGGLALGQAVIGAVAHSRLEG